MAREIDTDTQNALTAAQVLPVWLFEAEFDEGDVRFWTGYGELSWNSQTWIGTGTFGSVSEVEESTNIQANGVTVNLDGIPSSIISLALTYEYRGRPCKLYLGAVSLAAPNTLVGDPLVQMGGTMDVMNVEDSGQTGTVSVSIENRLIDLSRPKSRRYTHEDQQIDYPGDLGLEYVAGLQDKEVAWGAPTPAASATRGASPPRKSFD